MMKRLQGSLILSITAIIWGTSFVLQKIGMNYMEPFTYGAARFLIGGVILLPIILLFSVLAKKRAKNQARAKLKSKKQTKDLYFGGILCGCALFLGASSQQWGITTTTAGKAGFITALYIVLVPLFGIFMKKRISLLTGLGVGLAVIGLYLLMVKEGFMVQVGDAFVLFGTVFWALHIVVVDIFAEKTDGLKLSFIQFITAGLLSTFAAIVFEHPKVEMLVSSAILIIFTAGVIVGVAYTLQVIGQKYTSPTVAAIILSLEAVFAVISGAVFLGEAMSTRELIGCLFMFVAVIITQVKPQKIYRYLKKPSALHRN
ncbi:MAG: DMT family transporter [Clostridia bacterium]